MACPPCQRSPELNRYPTTQHPEEALDWVVSRLWTRRRLLVALIQALGAIDNVVHRLAHLRVELVFSCLTS